MHDSKIAKFRIQIHFHGSDETNSMIASRGSGNYIRISDWFQILNELSPLYLVIWIQSKKTHVFERTQKRENH